MRSHNLQDSGSQPQIVQQKVSKHLFLIILTPLHFFRSLQAKSFSPFIDSYASWYIVFLAHYTYVLLIVFKVLSSLFSPFRVITGLELDEKWTS